jgi:hypothetical protein
MEWDRDGVLSNGTQFFNFSQEKRLDELEKALGRPVW